MRTAALLVLAAAAAMDVAPCTSLMLFNLQSLRKVPPSPIHLPVGWVLQVMVLCVSSRRSAQLRLLPVGGGKGIADVLQQLHIRPVLGPQGWRQLCRCGLP